MSLEGFAYMIAVPLSVYINLQNTFDKGEKYAYSGKKDGTNRKLERRDGLIYSVEDGRQVMPLEYLMAATGAKPMNKFAEYVQKEGNISWAYDEQGKFIGIKRKNGSILAKEDFDKPVSR